VVTWIGRRQPAASSSKPNQEVRLVGILLRAPRYGRQRECIWCTSPNFLSAFLDEKVSIIGISGRPGACFGRLDFTPSSAERLFGRIATVLRPGSFLAKVNLDISY